MACFRLFFYIAIRPSTCALNNPWCRPETIQIASRSLRPNDCEFCATLPLYHVFVYRDETFFVPIAKPRKELWQSQIETGSVICGRSPRRLRLLGMTSGERKSPTFREEKTQREGGSAAFPLRFLFRQHRTIGVCGLRSKIFRQVVQKDRRLAGASQEIFVQHDGNRFKQGVRRDLCGVALILWKGLWLYVR